MTSWTEEGGEKPETSYTDLLREHRRAMLHSWWRDAWIEHARDGCPLIPAEDGSFAGACLLHGYNPNGPAMTYEEWMGNDE